MNNRDNLSDSSNEFPDSRHRFVAVVGGDEAHKQAEPSLGVRLLADMKTVFGDKAEISTGAILKALHELDESPWANLKGKPLDDRGLANRLRQYGIVSYRKWFGDKQARGYERASLTDAWGRYLGRWQRALCGRVPQRPQRKRLRRRPERGGRVPLVRGPVRSPAGTDG